MTSTLFGLCLLSFTIFPLGLLAWYRVKRIDLSRTRPPGWFFLGVAAVLLLLILMPVMSEIGGEGFLLLVMANALMAFAYAWVREFVGLMALGDEAFPGRHDKFLWGALMIFFPPVGLITFVTFRKTYWEVAKPTVDRVAGEMS